MASMVAPVWLCTSIKDVQRASLANQYTGTSERIPLWRVAFTNGYFYGEGMNLFFETEEQASDHFAQWQIYRPEQMMKAIPPTEQFVVQDVERSWFTGAMNQFTGLIQKAESWIAKMQDVNLNRFLDLRFPSEAKARRYSPGRAYSMLDMFGTLPSVPAEAVAQLEENAQKARDAQLAYQLAEQQAEQAALLAEQSWEQENLDQQALLNQGLTDALTKAQADASAAAADANQAILYEQAVARGEPTAAATANDVAQAKAWANAAQLKATDAQAQAAINPAAAQYAAQAAASAALAAKNASQAANLAAIHSTALYQDLTPGAPFAWQGDSRWVKAAWWTITNGGAGGTYLDPNSVPAGGGAAGEPVVNGVIYFPMVYGVFHDAGTFATPYNGLWYGAFTNF